MSRFKKWASHEYSKTQRMTAVIFGGFIFSFLILVIYITAGIFPTPANEYIIPLLLIAFAGTVVESLPFKDIDNITITLTALLLGRLLLG